MKPESFTPTHLMHMGGTADDGVWRECLIAKDALGSHRVKIITVYRVGDGPFVAGFELSGRSFEMLAHMFNEFSTNPEDYAIEDDQDV